MALKYTFNGNWESYWNNYDNVNELKKMSEDMDALLLDLEKGMVVKLLARDHFQIIDALENRIEMLEDLTQQKANAEKNSHQGELFAA